MKRRFKARVEGRGLELEEIVLTPVFVEDDGMYGLRVVMWEEEVRGDEEVDGRGGARVDIGDFCACALEGDRTPSWLAWETGGAEAVRESRVEGKSRVGEDGGSG